MNYNKILTWANIWLTPYLKYLLLAAILYIPIFGFLDALPIRIWDESRNALNAYEMLHNKNFIVTHYNGNPDMWNTKPPLLIWFQVLFMKIFGVNEISVRLPSALAALGTCIVILTFSLKYFKSYWFGFIAILVLITTNGYINFHSTRTGDYDSLLTLNTTMYCLLYFAYTETKNKKLLYGFFIFLSLAVLTKSVTGLMFLPALFIYTLIKKEVLNTLKNKHFYIGLSIFLILVIGYYVLREIQNPGYFKAVRENELGGRYLGVNQHNTGNFWFYYNHLIDSRLSELWYLLIPIGFAIGFASKDKKIRNLTIFLFLSIITFFLVISTAKTKLNWYDVPLFTFFSIIIGIAIYYIFNLLKDLKWFKKTLSFNVLPFVFIFVIFITPYQKIINKTFKPEEEGYWDEEFYEISYYLRDAVKGKYNVNNKYLLFKGYCANNEFYLNLLNDKNINISIKDYNKLKTNDMVIVRNNEIKTFLNEKYTLEKLEKTGNVETIRIYGRK